jgi:hypothetical protein
MAEAEIDVGGEGGDTTIGSRQKAKNGYGQNGFLGPSSDLPGKQTTSGFLPKVDPAIVATRGAGIAHDQDELSFRLKTDAGRRLNIRPPMVCNPVSAKAVPVHRAGPFRPSWITR